MICSVDPGAQRTGVALLRVQDNTTPELFEYWDIPGGPEGFTTWWAHKPGYDVLVVEDYIVRQGVHTDHLALQTVGFLRATEPDAIFQMPAGRKVMVSNDVLKRLGLYLTGNKNRNAIEAIRHTILYLRNQHHIPTLRVGFPDV
jgi:hypothetical protein